MIIRVRYPYSLPLDTEPRLRAPEDDRVPVRMGKMQIGTVVGIESEEGAAILVVDVDDAYAIVFTQPPIVTVERTGVRMPG